MDETWKQYEEKIRTEGYNKGKDDGYTLGKDDGYTLGKGDGYTLGKETGFRLGTTNGKDEERNNIALKMLRYNVDTQFIMQMTSISQDELKALKQQMEEYE